MDEMNRTNQQKVPKRVLNTLLDALSAGVVPRVGAPYIAIGRRAEIDSLLCAIDAVGEGGGAVRFLIGRYGSGKSFLLQLIRGYALERGYLTADADLSPERRLSGGSDAGLATYRELIRNLASQTSPDGGALPVVLARHFAAMRTDLAASGILPDTPAFDTALRARIYETTASLEGFVGGFDFARVLGEYYLASIADDSARKSACLRWLRGEYANKTEARRDLGFSVSVVIDDDNWYDFIKLFAAFSTRLGYRGLLLFVDECVNLYKIPNRISREANYEKLLTIFNDALQGRAENLGVIFGGTPQFLEDTRRGLFSYEALRSRLADSRFAEGAYTTLSTPVIRLQRLTNDELLALIARICRLFGEKTGKGELLTTDEMIAFLRAALSRAGSEELFTPRELIRDFLTVLHILDENPTATFADVVLRVGKGSGSADAAAPDGEEAPDAPASANPRPAFSPADINF